MTDRSPADADKPAQRRRPLRAALLVGLLAAAVFAALQAHRLLYPPPEAEAVSGDDFWRYDAGDESAMPASAPANLFDDPLSAGGGLAPLEGDPADVPPPSGAARMGAYSRRIGRQQQVFAHYQYCGDADSADEHYRLAFAARGFELVAQRRLEAAGRALVFARGGQRAVVSLQGDASNDKIDSIVVAVTQPAQ